MKSLLLITAALALTVADAVPQEPAEVSAAELKAAIDALGTLDFTPRMNAARTVRRSPAARAVPALLEAVESHKDGYVRFRALVLLAGFGDPRARELMLQALSDRNDRLRTVAYKYFEHHPDPEVVSVLLDALRREESEFVRPALTRALAAAGSDLRARDAMLVAVRSGEDFFRSAAIEAVGDYRAGYAVGPLTEIARLDGPLVDDAALALGKIGEKKSLETLAALQRTAPRSAQPVVAAAICLLGVNCSSHESFVTDTLRFAVRNSGFQDLLRSAASGLAAIAIRDTPSALQTLFSAGIPAQDPARAPIALAVGTVALRNPKVLLPVLEKEPDLDAAIELLRDAFDMLEEDFEEEQFYVTVRRTYWQSAEGSATRKVAAALIQTLEF
jgi:HEAT repeat protein